MTQAEIVERSGVPASTINRLRTSTRAPQPRVVHALADAVELDRDQAAQLAGLLPRTGDATVSVRDAVLASPAYTRAQKDALLAMIDALDEANQSPAGVTGPASPENGRIASA